MRTVNQLPPGIPRETDLTKFPDSTVLNETETNEGTPVVREIYGDVLTNLYRLLRLTGVVANGTEDNTTNGYQLVEALSKFPNVLNDIEQQLNLTGAVFSIPFKLSLLPDKYFVFARSVEDYVSTTSYTFKGSEVTTYPFTSPTGFNSGDEVLIIIDHSGVRAYSLTVLSGGGSVPSEIFTVFGTPLAYNDSNKIWYQSEGILFNDDPQAYDIQGAIRLAQSDGTILVYEMMVITGFLLCLAFTPGTKEYKLWKFSISALSTPIAVTGALFPTGSIPTDFKPYIFFNGVSLIITNDSGNSANDYILDIYTLNIVAGTVTSASSINLNVAYEKTTNTVIKAGYLYTFVNGELVQYNMASGVRIYGKAFPTYVGNIFIYIADVYYSNGEVAKKWTLPVYT